MEHYLLEVCVNRFHNVRMAKIGILFLTSVLVLKLLDGVDQHVPYAQVVRYGVNGKAVYVQMAHLWLVQFVNNLLLTCVV